MKNVKTDPVIEPEVPVEYLPEPQPEVMPPEPDPMTTQDNKYPVQKQATKEQAAQTTSTPDVDAKEVQEDIARNTKGVSFIEVK